MNAKPSRQQRHERTDNHGGLTARRAVSALMISALMAPALGRGVTWAAESKSDKSDKGDRSDRAAATVLPAGRYVVRARSGRLPALRLVVLAAGGTVVQSFDSLDSLVADLPAGAANLLQSSKLVMGIAPDSTVTPTPVETPSPVVAATSSSSNSSSGNNDTNTNTNTNINTDTTSGITTTWHGSGESDDRNAPVPPASGPIGDYATEVGSMYRVTRAIGAQKMWRAGVTGAGVDIAVIDTGVAPVAGLSGKIVNGPDLSLDAPYTSYSGIDAYGHGTHMASIAAGLDAGTTPLTDPSRFVGVAPGSRIVNVKVGAFDGATDVSQVIAAIDWVVQHRKDNGMNIRVLNLSYGLRSNLSYQDDPLSWAAEVAWRNGIVVVAAAGNDGAKVPIGSPAYNPRIIAVGAVDQSASISPASFVSGSKLREPDMWAPGAHILGLRVPGSFIDGHFPTAARGPRLFLGSGTSQATAIVSGAAALLVSNHPGASPDQIKAALGRSGRNISGQVGDFIQVQKASQELDDRGPAASIEDRALVGPARGTGSLEAARGGQHLTADGVALVGERDIMGQAWNGPAWAAGAWNGVNWTGGTWNGVNWTGVNWTGVNWTGVNWTGVNWTGVNWTAVGWAGVNWTGVNWTGVNWTGVNWTGVNWTGVNWTGVNWTGTNFVGVNWTAAGWKGAVWG